MHVRVVNPVQRSADLETTGTFRKLLFHICRSDRGGGGSISQHDFRLWRVKTGPSPPPTSAPPPLALQPLEHVFRMSVHRFHEGAHALRVHVGVEAVAQVGDVAFGAEALQHLLHDEGNAFLKEDKDQR